MKIVQVNTICGVGSIGRICVDLYETLQKNGEEAYIATGRGSLPPGIKGYVIGNKADFVCHVMKNFTRGKAGFGSKQVTEKFLHWLSEVQPDLVHLHNIHGFYLQIELLFAYLKEHDIPVVWTLHDCWSFTGHCAYFDYIGCEKWKEENGGCIIAVFIKVLSVCDFQKTIQGIISGKRKCLRREKPDDCNAVRMAERACRAVRF